MNSLNHIFQSTSWFAWIHACAIIYLFSRNDFVSDHQSIVAHHYYLAIASTYSSLTATYIIAQLKFDTSMCVSC